MRIRAVNENNVFTRLKGLRAVPPIILMHITSCVCLDIRYICRLSLLLHTFLPLLFTYLFMFTDYYSFLKYLLHNKTFH